jgi:hypothetical protein
VRRFAQVAFLLAGSALVALATEISDPGTKWAGLVLIGGAIAAGELLELRPPMRAPLPISFAFMVVLAERASIRDAALVLLVALLASFLVRVVPTALEARIALFGERLVEGMAAVVTYRVVISALGPPASRLRELTALAAAAFAPIVVAEVARMVRMRSVVITMQGRSADLALVTSAMLMGISDHGVNGDPKMGLWGPLIFTIPLLAAWYSYEQLNVIRRTYDQTIRALGAAPELGGIVREGHAERVASLALATAHELGFSRHELSHLETAALLHHLGQVCLDEPEDGRSPEPVEISRAGAEILRGTPLLAPAGDIIAAESMPRRDETASRPSVMAGQVLKVASAFDELSLGRPESASAALEALYSAPEYVYDARVLGALEVALDRAGLLTSVTP